MKEMIERMRGNTMKAAKAARNRAVKGSADPSMRFYDSLNEDDFRTLSVHYGMDRVSDFIRSMEFRKNSGGE